MHACLCSPTEQHQPPAGRQFSLHFISETMWSQTGGGTCLRPQSRSFRPRFAGPPIACPFLTHTTSTSKVRVKSGVTNQPTLHRLPYKVSTGEFGWCGLSRLRLPELSPFHRSWLTWAKETFWGRWIQFVHLSILRLA